MPNQATKRVLSEQTVAVIHHVVLNESGWWSRAVDRLVVAALWLLGEPADDGSVVSCIHDELETQIPLADIHASLARLVAAGAVYSASGDQYFLTEGEVADLRRSLATLQASEAKVRQRFLDAAESTDLVNPEQIWGRFCSDALMPMIQQMGARVYEIIKTKAAEAWLDADVVHTFLSQFGQDQATAAKCLDRALDPADPDVRNLVLSYLTASYCVASASLDAATITGMSKQLRRKPDFRILLDTNFLYSFLDLHDNPANEASSRLRALLTEIQGQVRVRLYVLPPTVEEMKTSLHAHRERIKRIQATPSVRRILGATTSGVAAKFYEKVSGSPTVDAINGYFEPYINDLTTVLRSKNIEVFNEDTSALPTDPDVVQDIHDWMDFERTKRNGPSKPRPYDRVLHDVVLWNFAFGKRRPVLESVLDADVWVATIDYRLLGFDGHKASVQQILPVCIHPSSLVQLLQFWVPRSETLDMALVDSIRLPLLSASFDAEAERVTLDILTSLSTFENLEDLPDQTIDELVMNRALRARIAEPHDESERVELVREALVQHNAKLTARLQQASAAADEQKRRADATKLEVERQMRLKEEQREQQRGLADENQSLKSELRGQQEAHGRFRTRATFAAGSVVTLFSTLFLAVGVWVAFVWRYGEALRYWRLSLSGGLPVIGVGGILIWGYSIPAIRKWVVFRRFAWVLGTLIVLVVFQAATSIYYDWLFEWFRHTFPEVFPQVK